MDDEDLTVPKGCSGRWRACVDELRGGAKGDEDEGVTEGLSVETLMDESG